MKNLIKVSTVSLVVLTLIFGAVGSAMAGSKYQSNKRVYKSFKQSSSTSRFQKRAPVRTSMKRAPLRKRYTPIGRAPMGQGMVKVPPPIEEVKPGTAAGPVGEAVKWIIKKAAESAAVEAAVDLGKDAVSGIKDGIGDLFPEGIPEGGQTTPLNSGPIR